MFKQSSKENEISFREALSLFISSIKRVWRYDKKYVLLTGFVFLLGTIPALLEAFVIAIFNQRLILGAKEYTSYLYVYYPLLIAFCVLVFNGVLGSIWRWSENKAMDRITAFLLREAAKKASMIDYASYDDPTFYDQVQRGWAQDGKMFINSATTVFTSISYVVGMVAYVSVLAYVDWKLMIAITVLRICFNPFINKIYTLIYRLNNQLAELRRKEQYYRGFFSNKAMASEGKIFNLNAYANENYLKAHKDIYKATFIHKLKVTSINLLSNVIYNLPLVAGYIYLSVSVYNGSVNLADMTLFVSMYVGFVDQMYNTIGNISSFRNYAEQSRYSRDFMLLPTNIFSNDDNIKEKIISKHNGHSIEFRNVTFRYPNTEKEVIKNVSFCVGEGETVSIIGANGAGKTTLIHLMMRLYDPTKGIILLDGKDIRDYSVEKLYQIYGVLFQDYCHYAVSAQESITLSTEEFADDKFNHALKVSTAYKFVEPLQNGINTPLSRKFDTNGAELSVGQKQRIALARAYYKDASIVIFDEPSASIDPESEAEIFAAINEMRGTKNIWLISHRLSTCILSDRILLFKDGTLIGNGSHNDLIKNNDAYKRMFQLQADRYEVN